MSELEEIKELAYENSKIYKERTKKWHDAKVKIKRFQEGEKVLQFNSRLRLFPGKLKVDGRTICSEPCLPLWSCRSLQHSRGQV